MLKEQIEQKKIYIVKLRELIKNVDRSVHDENIENFVNINTQAIKIFEKEIIELEKELEKETLRIKKEEKLKEKKFLENYKEVSLNIEKELKIGNVDKEKILDELQNFVDKNRN